jgi:hypothetical protein
MNEQTRDWPAPGSIPTLSTFQPPKDQAGKWLSCRRRDLEVVSLRDGAGQSPNYLAQAETQAPYPITSSCFDCCFIFRSSQNLISHRNRKTKQLPLRRSGVGAGDPTPSSQGWCMGSWVGWLSSFLSATVKQGVGEGTQQVKWQEPGGQENRNTSPTTASE